MKLNMLFLLVLTFNLSNTFAESFFKGANTDQEKAFRIRKLLGPYPAKGSVEEAQDFSTLHQYQSTRTEAECAQAKIEEKPSLKNFFGPPLGPLTEKQAKRMTVLFAIPLADLGIYAGISKAMYKRPRPYLTDPRLVPCVRLSSTYAYPSGHAAMARMFALMLAKIYPEKAEALIKRGDEVGEDRVLSGLHHPSDVVSGRKLGTALADHFIDTDDFKRNLDSLD